jgi:hypothetical protein
LSGSQAGRGYGQIADYWKRGSHYEGPFERGKSFRGEMITASTWVHDRGVAAA